MIVSVCPRTGVVLAATKTSGPQPTKGEKHRLASIEGQPLTTRRPVDGEMDAAVGTRASRSGR